jgi:hypothetical protein
MLQQYLPISDCFFFSFLKSKLLLFGPAAILREEKSKKRSKLHKNALLAQIIEITEKYRAQK